MLYEKFKNKRILKGVKIFDNNIYEEDCWHYL